MCWEHMFGLLTYRNLCLYIGSNMSTDNFYCSEPHPHNSSSLSGFSLFFFLAGPPLAFKGTAAADVVLLVAAGGALLVAGSSLLVADVVLLVADGALLVAAGSALLLLTAGFVLLLLLPQEEAGGC
jgi:hypothetical protein